MKKIGVIAAALGFCGVGLGAFGAHALRVRLTEAGMVSVWETAVLYHLVHAVAALAVCSSSASIAVLFQRAAWCWIAGIIAFSGSLYVLALGGPRWLGPVTPLGGVAFLAGWAVVGWAWWSRKPGAE